MNTLVVYFSRKGYVKKAAQKAALDTNGDLYEIKPLKGQKGSQASGVRQV